MTTISNITTSANATGAAHSYALATYSKVEQGQTRYIAKLTKTLNPANKSGVPNWGGHGESAVLTTAISLAVVSLNASRKHRYAGNPGAADGATVVADLHGDTNTVDSG